MAHKPGHVEDGCTKCIINDGFAGPIARLLAATVGEGSAAYEPAIELAEAAEAATKVFDHAIKLGLRAMPEGHAFKGCAEAANLVQMVSDRGRSAESVADLKSMRADILQHIEDLVSNNDISD